MNEFNIYTFRFRAIDSCSRILPSDFKQQKHSHLIKFDFFLLNMVYFFSSIKLSPRPINALFQEKPKSDI